MPVTVTPMHPMGPTGGGGPGQRGPQKISRADRAQLAQRPVEYGRVVALFRPHGRTLAVVTAIIVLTSAVAMAQPFLVREAVDVAIPQQDVRLLLLVVGGMVGVATATALLGVVQTWMAAQVGHEVMHTLRSRLFAHLQGQ